MANRENVDVEYKRIYVQELRKDIIAFANAEGGTFYIGINDDGSKRIKALYKNSEKQSVFESAQGAFKTTLFNLNIDEQSEKVISYQPETEKEIVMGLVNKIIKNTCAEKTIDSNYFKKDKMYRELRAELDKDDELKQEIKKYFIDENDH